MRCARALALAGLAALAALASLATSARADLRPITSRDFAIDLYDGVALGNTAMVGMGGAGAAFVLGTAGVLLNPSAIVVRSSTDLDTWSLDYHLDFLTGKYSSDYDNNGELASGGASLLTAGIGGRYHDWAAALTVTVQSAALAGSSSGPTASTQRVRLVAARWIPEIDLAVGGGLQGAAFQIDPAMGASLFSISGTTVIAGATWLPHDESFRVAAAFDGPVDGGQVAPGASCDPEDCQGYILPDRVRAPWRAVVGGAHRSAATAWNRQVDTAFRDEEAVTVAADVVVTGDTRDGYGVEAFGQHQLQRSGRHVAVSLRGGAEYEWLPGRLRVRGGGYWEPGRFDEAAGRFHITAGADLRVFAFSLWGPRRGRISATGDIATRYTNVVLSVGFWH